MRKLLLGSLLIASVAVIGGRPAVAGGMGDVDAHVREMNALCELQKRGEAPRNPDLCLPEYPPGPVETDHARGRY